MQFLSGRCRFGLRGRQWQLTVCKASGALGRSSRALLDTERRRALSSGATTASSDATSDSIERHAQYVREISAQVQRFYEQKAPFRITHGSTNSTRPSALHKSGNVVDTSRLSSVLHIDIEKQTALVEPNVPMDQLVAATLPHGLVSPVVMEFPGITVGGGYSGTSAESSSFRHGYFDRILNKVEMVLANGQVVTCSPRDKPDLFHGAAGALGTLGVTTLVEIQLRKAKKYVETTYRPVSSPQEAVKVILDLCKDPGVDFIDGILFDMSSGAVITGRMVDQVEPDTSMRRFSGARDPWYYLHVQDIVRSTQKPVTEFVSLAEYLFRYDRGGFWVGASAFKYFGMPFNNLARWFLDDFLHTRMLYSALHASGQSRKYIVQDIAFSQDEAPDFIKYNDEKLGIWPLWLCPLKQSPRPTIHPSVSDQVDSSEPLINVGLWGEAPSGSDTVAVNKDIEATTRRFGGMKWLYAHQYYSEDEFWQIYDRKWYTELREKYNATSLPSIYDKVHVKARESADSEKKSWAQSLRMRWPFSGIYGLKKAIETRAYLASRNPPWKSSDAS